MNTCEKCRSRLLVMTDAGDAASGEVADHLRRCPDCREYARAYRLLASTPLRTEVPPALDQAVLDAARRTSARRNTARPFRLVGRAFLRPSAGLRWAAAAAVVAAAVVLAWLTLPEPGRAPQPSAPLVEAPAPLDYEPWQPMGGLEDELVMAEAEIELLAATMAEPARAAAAGEDEPDGFDRAMRELDAALYFEGEGLEQLEL